MPACTESIQYFLCLVVLYDPWWELVLIAWTAKIYRPVFHVEEHACLYVMEAELHASEKQHPPMAQSPGFLLTTSFPSSPALPPKSSSALGVFMDHSTVG